MAVKGSTGDAPRAETAMLSVCAMGTAAAAETTGGWEKIFMGNMGLATGTSVGVRVSVAGEGPNKSMMSLLGAGEGRFLFRASGAGSVVGTGVENISERRSRSLLAAGTGVSPKSTEAGSFEFDIFFMGAATAGFFVLAVSPLLKIKFKSNKSPLGAVPSRGPQSFSSRPFPIISKLSSDSTASASASILFRLKRLASTIGIRASAFRAPDAASSLNNIEYSQDRICISKE
mmetsp:Transcript_40051/g.94031  ORF Transcript_40051/g.94031 Transcript_40051/m.94031 type:complete len:231 (-) Transcript_40051:1862-2554(-)